MLCAMTMVSWLCCVVAGPEKEALWTKENVMDRTMRPFTGPSHPKIDASTLTGKVLCGYQGWFTCEGDGSERGWFHWGGPGGLKPGSCSMDLWPDVSELDEDERYATPFRHSDGREAHLFSAMNLKTVSRHFEWMADYNIDGVFVQRFAGETFHPKGLNHCTTVLGHCRQAANENGRVYAVMYDLSGLEQGQMEQVMEDWRHLVDRMKISRDENDSAYLRHNGRPVVAVWGIGFSDDRHYTLEECGALLDFLKTDPIYGGCTVMIGVPTYWRTLSRDAVPDPKLHEILLKADIISPWTVGRYGTLEGASEYVEKQVKPDLEWCKARGKEYMPVVFPGFSWHNLKPGDSLNQIPRLEGRFLWQQYEEAIKAGATMIYQAMFDEVNEGTAIFKCTNDPPVGDSPFLTIEGLPSDHYLRLVGRGAKLLRERLPQESMR